VLQLQDLLHLLLHSYPVAGEKVARRESCRRESVHRKRLWFAPLWPWVINRYHVL